MAEKYKDQVIFLKVNADKEKELCGMFNIVALPTVFFIPVNGKPIVESGGYSGEIRGDHRETVAKEIINNNRL